MKLKAIFASVTAAVALLAACTTEQVISSIDGLEISNDYITLAAGDEAPVSTTITVKAAQDWTASAPKAEWIHVSPATGAAGSEVTVTLSADPNTGSERVGEVFFDLGVAQKIVKLIQLAPVGVETPESTCQDVMVGESDKTYKITGMITKITNNHYGNMYINDGTAEGDGVYIYGTNDRKGQKNNSSNSYDNFNDASYENSWDIAVGDIVTVQGPKTVYNGTVELVDVDIIKLEKSLIDVEEFTFKKLPAIDTTFNMVVDSKVQPLLVSSDVAWLQLTDVKEGGVYVLHADANDYTAERTATVTIKAPGALKTVAITQVGIPATGASVTDIVAQADGSEVETLESTTIAKTSQGVVIWDGTTAIYVYGNKAADVKVGDNVKVFGLKKTYNGVPEIELGKDNDGHKVDVISSGNSFSAPSVKDITEEAGTYKADKAEYIRLAGTLKVSGNYYNLILDAFPDGDKQGSIVSPLEELNLKASDGKKILVTGWFNGLSGGDKYINIVATKVVEFEDNPKGSLKNPYKPTEIAALILGGNTPDEEVYIKGTISTIRFTFSAQYGTAQFWISDDGVAHGVSDDKKTTTDPANDFLCYGVYYKDGQKWVEGDTQIEVGDEVLIYGKTTLYNGMAETSNLEAWVQAINEDDESEAGMGVAEMLALENGAAVESKTLLVTALTSRGFVASDGDKAVYVYTHGGDFNGQVSIGDKVKFTGSKTKYNNMHEIEKLSALEVVSSGNAVSYPDAKDVTASAMDYTADDAEFITFTGTLSVSGNYINVVIDGADSAVKQGSVVYPVDVEGTKALDGKHLRFTGYFNGLSSTGGKFLNVIATSIVEE